MADEGPGPADEASRPSDLLSDNVSSFRDPSPLSRQIIIQDLASSGSTDDDDDDDDGRSHGNGNNERAPMYRRPDGVVPSDRSPVWLDAGYAHRTPVLSVAEARQSHEAERELLLDNGLLTPPLPNAEEEEKLATLTGRVWRWIRLLGTIWVPRNSVRDEEGVDENAAREGPSQTSPLLGGGDGRDAALAGGKIRTTWWREALILASYAAPLMLSYMMQQSLNVTSLVAVGKIGKIELGAVSLATMTSAMAFNAPICGMATALDTLCAQAYGSGQMHLVGLQLQRMVLFLGTICIPVWIVFFFSGDILAHVVPEPRSAQLAGQYLRVLILGTPGIVLYESGKRFVQAQGLFRATAYSLAFAAPTNIFLNWLLVWKLEMGFIGASLAVAISQLMLPVGLLAYVLLVDGKQCWGGFSRRAWTNWGGMVRLSFGGMMQVWAEWVAFEIIAILSSQFGPEYLAAHTVMGSMVTVSYAIPSSFAVATSTRVANWVGAGAVEAAKTTAKTAFCGIWIIAAFTFTLFATIAPKIALAFTTDTEVLGLIRNTCFCLAVLSVTDGLAASSHGILRGLGKQRFGGKVAVVSHWAVGLPLSIVMAFVFGWKLNGLWAGVALALLLVTFVQYAFILCTDWVQAAREAATRNASN